MLNDPQFTDSVPIYSHGPVALIPATDGSVWWVDVIKKPLLGRHSPVV